AGAIIDISSAMIAITTSNSIRVNPTPGPEASDLGRFVVHPAIIDWITPRRRLIRRPAQVLRDCSYYTG
ncbi:hypothetical protein LCGC14_2507170, partial [marine sediment metagenome]